MIRLPQKCTEVHVCTAADESGTGGDGASHVLELAQVCSHTPEVTTKHSCNTHLHAHTHTRAHVHAKMDTHRQEDDCSALMSLDVKRIRSPQLNTHVQPVSVLAC